MIKVKSKKYASYWERNEKSGGYLFRKDVSDVMTKILRFILLFGLVFLILRPMLMKISVSFMTEEDLYNPIVVSIPEHFTGENYDIAAKIMNYSEGLKNSFVISFTIAALQVAMCTLVGYGFARFKFPLKKMWFAFVLGMIIVPPQAFSSSLYLHFRYWDFLGIVAAIKGEGINLRGTVLPYYLMSAGCMGLKNGLYIYLVRQFFRNIPIDLEEAAYVDGCGMLKTFLRIMLPEAKPIITSCFLFSFVWQWTDGFYSRMFLGTKTLVSTSLSKIVDSLSVYISKEMGMNDARVTLSVQVTNCILATGTMMIVLPVIILYLFAQKAFVESISSTGIKM